ncbi:Dehydrogenase/reductase SDR member 11 [Halocaridina rubra]|uniref:Dehydrogenase/reductase SDR member 11 n=1 Tax=Halocaridina rubra TaxID=373956 RepID=A0AAN9AGL6_HALRR
MKEKPLKMKNYRITIDGDGTYCKEWESEFKWLMLVEDSCYCTVCNVAVKPMVKSRLAFHEKTVKHLQNANKIHHLEAEDSNGSYMMEVNDTPFKANKWKSSYDKNRRYNIAWEKEFEWLSFVDNACFCKVCNKSFKIMKKSAISTHEKTSKHLRNLELVKDISVSKQKFIEIPAHSNSGFVESDLFNEVSVNSAKVERISGKIGNSGIELEREFDWLRSTDDGFYCTVCNFTITTAHRNNLALHEKMPEHIHNLQSSLSTGPEPDLIEMHIQSDSDNSNLFSMSAVKIKKLKTSTCPIRRYKREWDDEFDWLLLKNNTCYCTLCEISLNSMEKRSHVQHERTAKHVKRASMMLKRVPIRKLSGVTKISSWKRDYDLNRKYNKRWEREFKWLTFRHNACYCTYCQFTIKGFKRSCLVLHEKSKKHGRMATEMSQEKIQICFGKSENGITTASQGFEITYDHSIAHIFVSNLLCVRFNRLYSDKIRVGYAVSVSPIEHNILRYNTMNRWEGRVALVTGASAGIGAAICRQLVQAGMIVIGAARGVDRVEALAQELQGQPGKLAPVKCDVTSDTDVMNLFSFIKKEYRGVDVCINNAGMSHNHSLLEGTPKEWREMLDVNVVALCLCTRETIKSMQERGVDDGHIIHVNSMSGHRVTTTPGTHFYTATKHAVTGLTEGLRQELRAMKSHIRVSAISPGLVETEFAPRMSSDEAAAKAVYSSLKCLQADDIASSVVHILGAPPHMEIHDILVRPTEQVS